MDKTQLHRRDFLKMGAAGVASFLAGGQVTAQRSSHAPFFSLANVGPLQQPDENGLMLPRGFRSRIVARSRERPTPNSDYRWHRSPDGGACFPKQGGGWIYVSNCEEGFLRGGVGALEFNARGEIVDAYEILGSTSRNCAGGATPWGTWLSCEEFSRGQVYECDPFGARRATVRPALGTFKHEAAAVDLNNDTIYMTEDEGDGGFYRFTSQLGLPDLQAGRLEIASVVERDGGQYVEWLEVPDPRRSRQPTRYQNADYTPFNGGEGIAFYQGKLFFTTKGDNRVWCYDTRDSSLFIVYDVDTSDNPILSGVDNVVISPSGDVLVAEDGGDLQLVVITPEYEPLPLLQLLGHDRSELAGPAFDPSYQRLYVSSQDGTEGRGSDGYTFEISAIPG